MLCCNTVNTGGCEKIFRFLAFTSWPIEKRRHPRKEVKLLACIRQSGREHVVDCDDVSRGGFCFKGYRKYVVDMEIDVAMPYTRGGGNIFLPARIAHCKAGAAGVFKCGVAYKQKS